MDIAFNDFSLTSFLSLCQRMGKNMGMQDIKKIMNLMVRGIDRLAEWGFYAGAFLMLILPLMMSYEVAMRYFFNRPTAWASDFSEYFLLYSTFFAAGWLLRQKEHINMVFVTTRLHGKARWIFEIIQSLMGVFACGFMSWSGLFTTWDNFTRWTLIVRPLLIPKFIILWAIPFGELMLTIYFARMLISSLTGLLRGGDVAAIQEADGSLSKG